MFNRFPHTKLLLVFSGLVGLSSLTYGASAPPTCLLNSLLNYLSLTKNSSCSVGVLDYSSMLYIPDLLSPGAGLINVSPSAPTSGQAGFSFGPVTAAPGQKVEFEIDYNTVIDPAPVIVGDTLNVDVAGSVTATEYFCNNELYVVGSGLLGGGLCLGLNPAVSATVGNGNGQPNSANVEFSNPATVSQSVGIVITLNGGSTGASFDGFSSLSQIVSPLALDPPSGDTPEPVSFGCCALGLASLAAYRLRKRVSQISTGN